MKENDSCPHGVRYPHECKECVYAEMDGVTVYWETIEGMEPSPPSFVENRWIREADYLTLQSDNARLREELAEAKDRLKWLGYVASGLEVEGKATPNGYTFSQKGEISKAREVAEKIKRGLTAPVYAVVGGLFPLSSKPEAAIDAAIQAGKKGAG